MEPTTEKKKQKLSSFKIFLLLLLAFLLISFLLQQTDKAKVMKVQEKDQILHRPHGN